MKRRYDDLRDAFGSAVIESDTIGSVIINIIRVDVIVAILVHRIHVDAADPGFSVDIDDRKPRTTAKAAGAELLAAL